jgi:ABC-2 type transport system ATP-binding protein
MDKKAVIKVEHLGKTFKLPTEKNNSVKGAVVNFYRRKRTYNLQKALNDVGFEVREGEFFGIVGKNGSGKSTLLKILAGIYTPSSGSVEVTGKLTPFIELGVGFNPELTGRENVYLNGALLGFSRKEMQVMYQDIVNFAELDLFMDQKLKNYSSGMQVRLAFSIAIRAKSDILILDEVLAVGDIEFQQKCYDYFNELKNKGQTVVLVTHDMSAVRRFCERALLLDKGRVVGIGDPDTIAREYEKINLRNAEKYLKHEDDGPKYHERDGNREAEIFKTETFSPKTQKVQKTFFADEEKIGVRITFLAHEDIISPSVGFIFRNSAKSTVFATNNHIKNVKTKNIKKGQKLILECLVDNVFTNDKYTITCAIESTDFSIIYDRIEDVASFILSGHELAHSLIHPHHDFEVHDRET